MANKTEADGARRSAARSAKVTVITVCTCCVKDSGFCVCVLLKVTFKVSVGLRSRASPNNYTFFSQGFGPIDQSVRLLPQQAAVRHSIPDT